MRRAVLGRSALGKLEVADARAPVKATCRLVIFVRIVECAVVYRIDRDVTVITPAIRGSTLAARSIEKMLFT